MKRQYDVKDPARTRQLIEDTIEICLAHDRVNWRCPRGELVKCLRKNRYSFYTLRSGRTWTISSDDEQWLWDTLASHGFEFAKGYVAVTTKVHKPGHIPFDPPLHSNPKFLPEILKANASRQAKAPTKNPVRLLTIDPNESVDELKEALAHATTQTDKKKIRARLRSLGHRGGLR